MTRPHKPHSWPAVPGTTERAPLIDIVVFMAVCIVLLAGAVGAVCGFLVGLAGVLS